MMTEDLYLQKRSMLKIPAPLLFILFFIPSGFAQVGVPVDSAAFTKVDVEAEFPGGQPGWNKFLQKNLNADIPVDNDAPAGKYTVLVRFVVSKDGSITDIKALTKNGYGLEEEVIRIIEKSGKWTPAIVNGKAVNAYRKQPITFVTEEDGLEIMTKVPYTLFTGADNEITISAEKVKAEDITATISKGTIVANGNGKFIVKVTGTERVIIEIFNAKKKDKKIGAVIFDVKAP
jgi:hypothetical protein